MTDMVTQVARAICDSVEADEFDELRSDGVIYAAYMQQARAAIEVLRDMVPVVREDGNVIHELRGSPASIWKTLLDAALVEHRDADAKT